MRSDKPADLRYASNEERRFALAYLRWLAGGKDRRASKPSPTHRVYALTEARGERIRADVEQMVRDAAKHLGERLPQQHIRIADSGMLLRRRCDDQDKLAAQFAACGALGE